MGKREREVSSNYLAFVQTGGSHRFLLTRGRHPQFSSQRGRVHHDLARVAVVVQYCK